MKKKIRNFFETGVILTILFALVIQGVATTESTLSEEICSNNRIDIIRRNLGIFRR